MTDRPDPTPAVEALREALAYAIARVPPPPAARSVREYAADLAPYLIESGYLTPAQPVTETTDLRCDFDCDACAAEDEDRIRYAQSGSGS